MQNIAENKLHLCQLQQGRDSQMNGKDPHAPVASWLLWRCLKAAISLKEWSLLLFFFTLHCFSFSEQQSVPRRFSTSASPIKKKTYNKKSENWSSHPPPHSWTSLNCIMHTVILSTNAQASRWGRFQKCRMGSICLRRLIKTLFLIRGSMQWWSWKQRCSSCTAPLP